MAAERIDIRDGLRSSGDIIRLSSRTAEQKWGRADIPEPVQINPKDSPRTLWLLVPLMGLIVGIHLFRLVQKTRRRK